MKTSHSASGKLRAALTGIALSLAGASIALGQGTSYGPMYSHTVNGLGFYLGTELGLNFMPDFQSPRFGFPATFKTDPGMRFTIAPGFDFLSTPGMTMGAEFDTGVLYNYIYKIETPGVSLNVHGDYYQVPFLGVLSAKFHPNPNLTPYISVGGGGVYSDATLYQPGYYYYYYSTSASETKPAAQGSAGLRFRLNPVSEIGFGYTFLGIFPGGDRFVQNHAVVCSFCVNF